MLVRTTCFTLAFAALAYCQAAPEITLTAELENWVWYTDEGDSTKYATVRETVPPLPSRFHLAFKRHLILADLVSVGGKPAAGTFFANGVALNTSTSTQPSPGRPIADFPRNQMHEFVLEIMTADRAQVGSLVGFYLGSGTVPRRAARRRHLACHWRNRRVYRRPGTGHARRRDTEQPLHP